MKIIFLVWNTKKCGGNKVIFEYANRLKEKGYEVRVAFVINSSIDWFDLKVKKESFWLFRWIKEIDILIATFWPTVYLSFFFPAIKKVYFVLGWEPDYYTNPLLVLMSKITYKFPFKIITISKFLAKKVQVLNSSVNITVCRCAIDLKLFKPGKRVNISQRNEIRILSVVSAYQRYKGVDNLIRLITILKKRSPGKFHFVLLGFERKIFSSVFDEFISNVTDKKLVNEYRRADLLLATPRVEGFFLPGLEAMACGCPVITTDSGGVREYAKNNYNCIMASTYEEIIDKGFVEKIVTEIKFRNRLVENGIKTSRKYSWNVSVSLFEKAISY